MTGFELGDKFGERSAINDRRKHPHVSGIGGHTEGQRGPHSRSISHLSRSASPRLPHNGMQADH
jgi:hypothetical protein